MGPFAIIGGLMFNAGLNMVCPLWLWEAGAVPRRGAANGLEHTKWSTDPHINPPHYVEIY